jgi:hypothetical protein
MSKKTKYYCQCRFECKTSDDSCLIDVAWIPEKFAKVNKLIRRKGHSGIWKVTNVFKRMKSEDIEANEMDYKKQRKVSDV